MSRRSLCTCVVLAAVVFGGGWNQLDADEQPDSADIRMAVRQALPYLEDRGDWWAEEKGCVSCHRNSFQVWSHAEAAARGFEVDRQKLQQWWDRSMQQLQSTNDQGDVVGTRNPDGAAQLLLAYPQLPPSAQNADAQQQLQRWLQEARQPDGTWQAAGQLPMQKRPKPETHQVSSLWNQLALRIAEGGDSGLNPKPAASADVTASTEPRQALISSAVSTEALVVLLLNSAAEPARSDILQTLQSEQNADGGWGWIRKENSDPLVTGQVLYALAQLQPSGLATAASPESLQNQRTKAVAWLLETQAENGSWKTKGTKQNRRTKVSETATYWGSAWAVIGLLHSL